MATLSITVPDDMVNRLTAALIHNHPEVDVGGLNPGPAAKKIVVDILRKELLFFEKNDVIQAALAEAELAAEAIN